MTRRRRGFTRQILTATLYLREHWLRERWLRENGAATESTETTAEKTSEPETDPLILDATKRLEEAEPQELFRWSGKTPLLEASAMLGDAGEVNIVFAPQLVVEFSEGVRVVLMTDRPAKTLRKLLDQFKTTGPPADHPRRVMQAVLALKRAAGKSTSVTNDPGAELSEAIREDRIRIAVRTRRLLSSIASSGIAHPSTRIVQRVRTSAVAAEAAKFPRLARILGSIADDTRRQIDRDASADSERMAGRMSFAMAMADAASKDENAEKVELFGRSRSLYTPAGDLKLSGLGAHGWRTASGFGRTDQRVLGSRTSTIPDGHDVAR